jgi:uracil-DNA glycosylase
MQIFGRFVSREGWKEMDFVPEIWPEEAAPEAAAGCRGCELYKQRTRVIWGEGGANARIVAILDNPGAREDKEGNAFVCATRGAMQRAVKAASLEMNDVYATYLLKCRPIRAYDKPAARQACFGWLNGQIEEKKPEVIVLLGLVVAQEILSKPDAQMAEFRGRWHEVFGGIPAVVTYHPLAVHRRPNLLKGFIADWRMAAERLRKPTSQ